MGKIKPSKEVQELQLASGNEISKILNVAEEAKQEKQKIEVEENNKLHLVNFKLPMNDFNKYRNLFGGNGYSFSQGNRMVLDWFYREVEAGNLELSTSGIRETLSKKMRG